MQVKDLTKLYSKRVADLTEELVYSQALCQLKDQTIEALAKQLQELKEKYEPVEQPVEEN